MEKMKISVMYGPVYLIVPGSTWTSFDPLTISDISVRIYEQLGRLLCPTNNDHKNCHCHTIQRHYGRRPFKCGFLSCSFNRHGFESSPLLRCHVKYHDRPWKCSVEDCEFAEKGFLSRKMRDEHLDHYHKGEGPRWPSHLDKTDADEIQPLLFDLVRADKVDAVRDLLPQFRDLDEEVREELQKSAAFSGSCTMIDLITPVGFFEGEFPFALLRSSILGKNMETFKHLL